MSASMCVYMYGMRILMYVSCEFMFRDYMSVFMNTYVMIMFVCAHVTVSLCRCVV